MRGRRLGPGLALLAAVAPLAAAAQSPDPFGNRLGGGLPSPSITTPDLPPSQPEGEATLSRNKAEFEEHWTKDLEIWFPDGIDTPGIVLIKVHAGEIEYWDGSDNGKIPVC